MARGFARVARARHGVHIGPRRTQRHHHVGDLALHQLERADGFAELLALAHIGQHYVKARLHDAERPRRQHGAFVVEPAHQHGDAAIEPAHDVFFRNFAILEHQFASVRAAHAHLVELLPRAETLYAALDQKRGDPARASAGIGLCVYNQSIRVRRVGDPELGSVEHIAIAALLRAQLHADDIRARARFAHRQRADMLAADQLRQNLALLPGRRPTANLVDAEIGVRAVAQADGAARPAHFFHRHDVFEIAEPQAAILFRHRDPMQPERAHLGPEFTREGVGSVDLGGERRNAALGEFPRGFADGVGGLAEGEIEFVGLGHGLPARGLCGPFSPPPIAQSRRWRNHN